MELIMKGRWSGFYQYDKEAVRKAVGHDRTFFAIKIDVFDGRNFSGEVQDDVTTGGMTEKGKIFGFVEKGEVYFEKYMPNYQTRDPKTGERISFNRKHPALYYTGILSDDERRVEGKWRFKNQVGLLAGFIPFPVSVKGTWMMKRS